MRPEPQCDIIQIELDLHGVPTTFPIRLAFVNLWSYRKGGIKRSVKAAANADLILVILDGSDKEH